MYEWRKLAEDTHYLPVTGGYLVRYGVPTSPYGTKSGYTSMVFVPHSPPLSDEK